jgi:uncharacterized protein (TIGR01244 family)
MKKLLPLAAVILAISATPFAQAKKETLDGVRNYTVVDVTIGCAGATEVAAIPAIAAKGYKSVVNLRLETEAGANVPESRAAAEKAGLKYIHLPWNSSAPDPAAGMAVADAFIAAVTDKANQPAFIHCGSANRVAALWMTKRILVDKWDDGKALEEAKLIGLTSPALEKFAMDYVAARRK